MLKMPWKFGPSKAWTSSRSSFQITGLVRLSIKFTCPGGQPSELTHTQWLLLMFKIWIKSPVIISNCLIGTSVGRWKPRMLLLTCCKMVWASCIIVPSNHPVGDMIRSYSACPSLAYCLYFSIRVLLFYLLYKLHFICMWHWNSSV